MRYGVVNRCVCADMLFAELLREAAETGEPFEELSFRTGCGAGCGYCTSYAKLALASGQAELPLMTTEELEHAIAAIQTQGATSSEHDRGAASRGAGQ